MTKKMVCVALALMLALAGVLGACAEEEIYNALADKYLEAVAAEQTYSEEQALKVFEELVDFYEAQDRRNQRFRDASYYYSYAQGRICFSRGEYADAMEWFGDLVYAGQTDAAWLNLSFYHDFSQALFYLEEQDVETALPLLIKAEQENAEAVSLCEEQIDVCAALLEQQIDAACAQKDYDLADHYCDLYDMHISRARARALRKQVEQRRANSSLTWGSVQAASTLLTLAWSGGIPPYTVLWSQDLRGEAAMHSLTAADGAITLTGLLPGTLYQLRVRDSSGTETPLLQQTTAQAQGYRLAGGTVQSTQVNVRQYKPAQYTLLRGRQGISLAGLVAYDNATQRVNGPLAVDWAAVSAGSVGYMAVMDTNTRNLRDMQDRPCSLVVHLEGLGSAAADLGRVGGSECCVEGNMVVFAFQQALQAAFALYAPQPGCAWTVDLLVNGLYIGSVAGQ